MAPSATAFVAALALVQSCMGFQAPGLFAQRAPSLLVMEELDENSPAFRAASEAERAALVAARMAAAEAMDMSAEEISALTEASKSLEPCWTGPVEECPKDLINIFSQKPMEFFGALRSPKEDPAPQVWLGVRSKWPVLAERSDDDLLTALEPIKAIPVDRRYL